MIDECEWQAYVVFDVYVLSSTWTNYMQSGVKITKLKVFLIDDMNYEHILMKPCDWTESV